MTALLGCQSLWWEESRGSWPKCSGCDSKQMSSESVQSGKHREQ